jgi:hypothetical protein
MIEAVLRAVLRCSHSKITRPITPLDRSGVARCGTYVVCLDCGTEMPYDWEHMRVNRQKRQHRPAKVLIGERS